MSEHCAEGVSNLSCDNDPSSLLKFPCSDFINSNETQRETIPPKTVCNVSSPENSVVSLYDELHSFTLESPEIELSAIEYVIDNQFESCSDSELGTPTPSGMEPLSSEMFIATICESTGTDVDKSSTIKKKPFGWNKTCALQTVCKSPSNEDMAKIDNTKITHTNNHVYSNSTDQKPIEVCQNDANIIDLRNENESNSPVETGRISKRTEVKINLVCSNPQSPSERHQENNIHDKSEISYDCFDEDNYNKVDMFFPALENSDDNCMKQNTEEHHTSQSGGVEIIGMPTFQNVKESNTADTFAEKTYTKEETENAEDALAEMISVVSTEDNIGNSNPQLQDSKQIFSTGYKNVQEQIRTFENSHITCNDEITYRKPSMNEENRNIEKESSRKTSLSSNAENERQYNYKNKINDPEQCENLNLPETLSRVVEINHDAICSAPVPPPRASSKNLIPPPIPPFVEDDEEQLKPPVPPLPELFNIRSVMTSPLPPQRQYLLVPIEHFNYRIPQQPFLPIPSPPQRTTSYKKFMEMTPNRTTHHSPECLKNY